MALAAPVGAVIVSGVGAAFLRKRKFLKMKARRP
jgi:hypothetical protein